MEVVVKVRSCSFPNSALAGSRVILEDFDGSGVAPTLCASYWTCSKGAPRGRLSDLRLRSGKGVAAGHLVVNEIAHPTDRRLEDTED